VAVVAGSRRTFCFDFAPSRAHVLQRILEVDLLATVTPSFVMVGDPYFLSITTLRPFGPGVTLTASASWLIPRSTACRMFTLYTTCFAILFYFSFFVPALDDAENFVFAHR
jgi:hypothetical protein